MSLGVVTDALTWESHVFKSLLLAGEVARLSQPVLPPAVTASGVPHACAQHGGEHLTSVTPHVPLCGDRRSARHYLTSFCSQERLPRGSGYS